MKTTKTLLYVCICATILLLTVGNHADTKVQKQGRDCNCHSLDAADGDPSDVLYVDENGFICIGSLEPQARFKLTIISQRAAALYAREEFRGNFCELAAVEWGVRGNHAASHSYGYLGGSGTGAYGECGRKGNYGTLGTETAGAGGYSDEHIGVEGVSEKNVGVEGVSQTNAGVYGRNDETKNTGTLGTMKEGVFGKHMPSGNYGQVGSVDCGAYGYSSERCGVRGESQSGIGVHAYSKENQALRAETESGTAVTAISESGAGLIASGSPNAAELTGNVIVKDKASGKQVLKVVGTSSLVGRGGRRAAIINGTVVVKDFGSGEILLETSKDQGLFAAGSPNAAVFKGNVVIQDASTGDVVLELGKGLDLAEGFDVTESDVIRPGAVLIIDPDNPGKLALSEKSYDTRVAGIVAGAGDLGSAVRLGAGLYDYDVALAGRVYCNVDATELSVEPGDLLTSSDIPGYAMKAADDVRARGAILGKAMERLKKGERKQVLVLVTLQ